jgi:tetratricopeptide (TPR) repeat protein
MQKPGLEESLYWRGLAREQTGDLEGAIADLKKSVELNPNFTAGYEQLERLGIPAP